jgi:DNA repair protein RadC
VIGMTGPQDSRFIEAKQRAFELGVSALSGSELLAIVLGTGSIPSAVDTAQRLWVEHGGVFGIARLGVLEMAQVPGMGVGKAIQLKAAIDLGSRLQRSTLLDRPQIKTPQDAAQLVLHDMGLLEQEEVRTVMLDTRNRVLGTTTVYRGSLNSASIRLAELFKAAIRANAAGLILCHNHPSGDCAPSASDIQVTREVIKAGKLLEIDIVDHLIIGQGQFLSLKERGMGFDGS